MSGRLTLQQIPAGITTAADYEAPARKAMEAAAWAYFHACAGDGLTERSNRAAWDALELLPRVLRPLAGLEGGISLLGRRWPTPLLVAPMAAQRLAHADGELATALAASAQGTGLVLSSEASTRLEDVAAAMLGAAGRGPLWLQLYLLPERAATLDLVRRAEAAGYEALVVTVDAAVRGPRAAELRAGFHLPAGMAVNLPQAPPAAAEGLQALAALAPTWADMAWLRANTRLPVLLKGVLHPADAREAQALGVQGLIVSNHGGRTLDGACATARALPAVVDAVAGALPVLVDGGIRRGTDALKALALGASAVLVGRPVIWGLATAGAAGVAHVLRLILDELAIGMAQCGARQVADLDRDILDRRP